MFVIGKLAIDQILIGKDWTIDLDGATIASVADAITSDPALTCESAGTVDNVTKYWLRGGGVGLHEVLISVVTSAGETLGERFSVAIS